MKNNYPLPLITELVDNMGSKRVFTKMDLWWGYNNVRVKEGDEWKVAFTTYVGLFKPVVMFFWDDKLASNIPSNDERDSKGYDQ